MQIRNLFLLASRQFSRLQSRSEQFWENANFSFLASEEVYQQREGRLRDTLAKIGRVRSAIDIGCGNGRFTVLLLGHADHVTGFDISAPLVSEAREHARLAGLQGIEFIVSELEQVAPAEPSSLTMCLGVTSCLVDEDKYRRALDKLAAVTEVGGWLILVDTLSDGRGGVRTYRSGYIGRYRPRRTYEQEFSARGFELVESHLLSRMGGDLANYFFCYRKRS